MVEAAVEDRVDGPKRARRRRKRRVDRLSSLPQPLLETIVRRLPLSDVWSLWRCNRALCTAVRRLPEWRGLAVLGRSSWMESVQPFHGLAALRMFAPGAVPRISLLHLNLVGDLVSGERRRHNEGDDGSDSHRRDHGYHPSTPPPGVDQEGRETADRRAARCALECLLLHVPCVTELQLNCRLSNDSVCYCDDRPCFHTTPTSRTVPPFPPKPVLASFTLLKTLITSCEYVDAQDIVALTSLTSLGLFDTLTDSLLQAALTLPSLTQLCVDGVYEPSLSAATVREMSRLQRLDIKFATWSDRAPAWLGRLAPLTHFDAEIEYFDLRLLSSLPNLRSAGLSLFTILEPSTRDGSFLRSAGGSASAWAWSLSQLTSLTIRTVRGGRLPLWACSGLRELNVCLDGLSLEGSLASMPLLTSLTLEASNLKDDGTIDMRELSSLAQLKRLSMWPASFRKPWSFAAMGHVKTVRLEEPLLPEHTEHETGLTALTQATGLRSLTLTTFDPLRTGGYLDGVTCLTRLCLNENHDRTRRWFYPMDVPPPRTWQFGDGYGSLRSLSVLLPAEVSGQELAVRCELPQLTELDLTGFVAVEREWAWLLPNLVTARLLDLEAERLPDLERGAWPRLLRLVVGGARLRSVPWSWFTLPSVQYLTLFSCKALQSLPDIPRLAPSRSAPLRRLELTFCPELSVLPLTLTRLQELQLIDVFKCEKVRVPEGLDSEVWVEMRS